jgi:hypothetical protein
VSLCFWFSPIFCLTCRVAISPTASGSIVSLGNALSDVAQRLDGQDT